MKTGDKVRFKGLHLPEEWGIKGIELPQIGEPCEVEEPKYDLVSLGYGDMLDKIITIKGYYHENGQNIVYPLHAFDIIDGNDIGERAPIIDYKPYGESIYYHRIEKPKQPHMR